MPYVASVRLKDVSASNANGLNLDSFGRRIRMRRRFSSLLLFVGGYLLMASLAPLVALGPALLSFFAGLLVLARDPDDRRAARRRARSS